MRGQTQSWVQNGEPTSNLIGNFGRIGKSRAAEMDWPGKRAKTGQSSQYLTINAAGSRIDAAASRVGSPIPQPGPIARIGATVVKE
jgi:hypothetical protein